MKRPIAEVLGDFFDIMLLSKRSQIQTDLYQGEQMQISHYLVSLHAFTLFGDYGNLRKPRQMPIV